MPRSKKTKKVTDTQPPQTVQADPVPVVRPEPPVEYTSAPGESPHDNIKRMIAEDQTRRRTQFAVGLQQLIIQYNCTLVAAFEYNPTVEPAFQGKVLIVPQ